MTNRLLVAMLLGVLAVEAHAGSVEVKNCSNETIRVSSYNSTDTILFASYASISIDNRNRSSIGCGTDSCKLKVEYGGGSFNGGWMNFTYSWGVCAQGPWNAELAPIERCTC